MGIRTRDQRRGVSFTDKKAMAVRDSDWPWGLPFLKTGLLASQLYLTAAIMTITFVTV
jgi:hypothetical protein